MTTLTEINQKVRQAEIDIERIESDLNAKETNKKGLEAEKVRIEKLIEDNNHEMQKKQTEMNTLARTVVQSRDRLRQIVQEIPKLKTEMDTMRTKLGKANQDHGKLKAEHDRLETSERNKPK